MSVTPDEPSPLPIEQYVDEVGTSARVPAEAISVCVTRYPEAGPLLRTALIRAADGRMFDSIDERLFFRAMHIVGACRDPLGFQPLLRFLQRADEDSESLLGDASVLTLPAIVAGVFDGDAETLLGAIVEPEIEQSIREALLRAAAFLTWDGRIDKPRMVQFLERFDSDRPIADGDLAWYGWAQTIAFLGLRDMVPAVVAAAARGSIDPALWAPKVFDEILAEAERAPGDIARFKDDLLGYLDDAVAAVQEFDADDDDVYLEQPDLLLAPSYVNEPVVNPWRGVGRNHPCPCGSGKKAKRCCLAA